MKPQLLIACDFDGTVTRQDTLVEILNRYGSPTWTCVQEKVVSGELSIWEGLQSEMRSVRATRAELERLLADRVQVDPTFPGFLRRMRERGVPVVLITGGFDLCVEAVMAHSGLWPVPFLANRLRQEGGSWQVDFPYPSDTCTACGHCKGAPVRNWRAQGYTTVFAGNGVTDRCAAMAAGLCAEARGGASSGAGLCAEARGGASSGAGLCAEARGGASSGAGLTFAKEELERWCRQEAVPAVQFENFDDIQEELEKRAWL